MPPFFDHSKFLIGAESPSHPPHKTKSKNRFPRQFILELPILKDSKEEFLDSTKAQGYYTHDLCWRICERLVIRGDLWLNAYEIPQFLRGYPRELPQNTGGSIGAEESGPIGADAGHASRFLLRGVIIMNNAQAQLLLTCNTIQIFQICKITTLDPT